MKSRRRIAFPKAQDHANRAIQLTKQSRKHGLTKWGPTAFLRRENLALAMSLKGQKPTFPDPKSMSALHPEADIDEQSMMSAKCQKATYRAARYKIGSRRRR
jgi:hypothetical protein